MKVLSIRLRKCVERYKQIGIVNCDISVWSDVKRCFLGQSSWRIQHILQVFGREMDKRLVLWFITLSLK